LVIFRSPLSRLFPPPFEDHHFSPQRFSFVSIFPSFTRFFPFPPFPLRLLFLMLWSSFHFLDLISMSCSCGRLFLSDSLCFRISPPLAGFFAKVDLAFSWVYSPLEQGVITGTFSPPRPPLTTRHPPPLPGSQPPYFPFLFPQMNLQTPFLPLRPLAFWGNSPMLYAGSPR